MFVICVVCLWKTRVQFVDNPSRFKSVHISKRLERKKTTIILLN